jgi:hypothetical protein
MLYKEDKPFGTSNDSWMSLDLYFRYIKLLAFIGLWHTEQIHVYLLRYALQFT